MTNFINSLTPEVILGGLMIFFLRTMDMSMDTLRVLFVVRGKKSIVWCLGVVQSVIYITAISSVLSGDKNPFTILCYACGFATGNIFGMFLEEKLAVGFRELSIISQNDGEQIAAKLRDAGYGVTEMFGEGRDGVVEIIRTNVKRKQASEVLKIVGDIDPKAFVTQNDFVPVNTSGHWK